MSEIMHVQKRVAVIAQEVHRIISAPYAVLYKTLLHVLIKSDDDHIYAWTVAKSCQIPPLISRIIEALRNDRAAFRVLLKLIVHCSVRDEVLDQNPTVLRTLYSEAADQDVFEACIKMCRHPFPKNFAPPIEYFNLVDTVLENAQQVSLQLWILRMHSVLSNAPAGTLATTDESVLRKCISLWSEAGKSTDNITFISFTAAAALVYRHDSCSELALGHENSAAKHDVFEIWKAKCSSLFTSSKVHKIIKSLLLRTLYILSEASSMQTQDLLQCVEMVRLVFESISTQHIQDAMQDHEAIQILTKLAEKTERRNIDVVIQLAVSSIFQIIDPDHQFLKPTLLHSSFREFMQCQLPPLEEADRITSFHATQNLRFHVEHARLWAVVGRPSFAQKAIVQHFMERAMKLCQSDLQCNIENTITLQSASLFLATVRQMISNAEVSHDAIDAIVDSSLPRWWDWHTKSIRSIEPQACQYYGACPHALDVMQWQLASSIASVIIAASCTSERRLSRDVHDSLERTMRRDVSIWNRCRYDHAHPRFEDNGPRPTSDLFTTPDIFTTQSGLDEMLTNINAQTSEAISLHINSVCRDLQLRCEDVEAPLRAEQRKYEELQREMLTIKQSTDVMLAEHQARRLSWQHSLEVEQEKVASLRNQQAASEQNLEVLRNQMAAETEKKLIIEQSNANLSRQYEEIKKENEQEAANIQRCKDDCMTLTINNEDLQRQLREAREKEQRLLSVLSGPAGDT